MLWSISIDQKMENETYPHCKRLKLTGFQQEKAEIVDKSVDTVDKHLFASHNLIIVDNFFE